MSEKKLKSGKFGTYSTEIICPDCKKGKLDFILNSKYESYYCNECKTCRYQEITIINSTEEE